MMLSIITQRKIIWKKIGKDFRKGNIGFNFNISKGNEEEKVF